MFLVSTLVMLAARRRVDRARKARSRRQPTYRVAVTAPAPPGLAAALQRAAKPFDDAKVRLRVVASPAAGRQALDDEKVDALLLLSQDRLVFRTNVDAKAAAVADTAVRALRNHLPPGTGADGVDAPSARETRPTDAETLVAYARLAAPARRRSRSTASGCSPASSRRRATASSS